MNKKKMLTGLLAVLLMVGLQTNFAHAGKDGSFTLQGLKAVYVVEPSMNSELKDQGLNPMAVKNDMEKKLKQAGINVISKTEFDKFSRSETYQLARIDTLLSASRIENTDITLYDVTFQVHQLALLARKPAIKIWSPTWEVRRIMGGSNSTIVTAQIEEAIEEFIRDFRAANALK